MNLQPRSQPDDESPQRETVSADAFVPAMATDIRRTGSAESDRKQPPPARLTIPPGIDNFRLSRLLLSELAVNATSAQITGATCR